MLNPLGLQSQTHWGCSAEPIGTPIPDPLGLNPLGLQSQTHCSCNAGLNEIAILDPSGLQSWTNQSCMGCILGSTGVAILDPLQVQSLLQSWTHLGCSVGPIRVAILGSLRLQLWTQVGCNLSPTEASMFNPFWFPFQTHQPPPCPGRSFILLPVQKGVPISLKQSPFPSTPIPLFNPFPRRRRKWILQRLLLGLSSHGSALRA